MISCCQHVKSRDPVSSIAVRTQKTWLSGAGAAAPGADRTPAGPELACARMFFPAKQQQGNSPTSLQLGEQDGRRLCRLLRSAVGLAKAVQAEGAVGAPGLLLSFCQMCPGHPGPCSAHRRAGWGALWQGRSRRCSRALAAPRTHRSCCREPRPCERGTHGAAQARLPARSHRADASRALPAGGGRKQQRFIFLPATLQLKNIPKACTGAPSPSLPLKIDFSGELWELAPPCATGTPSTAFAEAPVVGCGIIPAVSHCALSIRAFHHVPFGNCVHSERTHARGKPRATLNTRAEKTPTGQTNRHPGAGETMQARVCSLPKYLPSYNRQGLLSITGCAYLN